MNTRADEWRKRFGVSKNGVPVQKEFKMTYGFSEQYIVVQFGLTIDNLTMSVGQCEDMINALIEVRDAFVKSKAA